MTNLTRVTGKVFGETASPTGDVNNGPYIGQFGSAKAGTYNGTDDVATIQSLPAWSNGFIDAVTPSQQFPTLPEMTGFGKVLSYQNAYLLQKGVAEWEGNTTYYTTSYCQYLGCIYRSKIDDNTGHTPISYESDEYWQCLGNSFLNNQQITNYLWEVPNNVKLELSGGTLTIKAGTKVTVPNGFESDGTTPKFDELVIENDIVCDYINAETNLFLMCKADGTASHCTIETYTTSGTTAPSSGSYRRTWYDTTNNIIKSYGPSETTYSQASFPIAIVTTSGTNTFSSINQIFNGLGYIGSIVYADKGIRWSGPDGRMSDGGVSSTVRTTTSVYTLNLVNYTSSRNNGFITLGTSGLNQISNSYAFYNPTQNILINGNTSNQISVVVVGGYIYDSNKKITKAYFNNALNLNAYMDGSWIYDSKDIISSNTTFAAETTYNYSLATYLPDDGYAYEVYFSITGNTGTTSGNSAQIGVGSSFIPVSTHRVVGAQTRSSSSVAWCGNCVIPIGIDRTVSARQIANAACTCNLFRAFAYRRIGRNI